MSLRSIIGKHKEIGEYGCNKCNHYIPEYYSCTLKECIHGDKNTIDKNILDEIIARTMTDITLTKVLKNKKHKCENCPWSTWVGNKFVCLFPRCIRYKNKIRGEKSNGKEKIQQT